MENISLKVNNEEVPLNPFVQHIFINVVNGLIDSLDKIPDEKYSVEIKIEKN